MAQITLARPVFKILTHDEAYGLIMGAWILEADMATFPMTVPNQGTLIGWDKMKITEA